jgi:nucleoside-diphosphate-sugar epimerase
MMTEVSVFGATGFIGSHFVGNSTLQTNVTPRNELTSKSSEVLFFIGTTDNYNVFEDHLIDVETNITHMLDCLKASHVAHPDLVFNFISTWFVYGENPLPFSEEQECRPKGFYSITKRTSEQLLESFCLTFGIKYRIIRLANTFGRSDLGVSKKKNALQFLIEKLKKGEPIELYEGGNFIRDYIHVSDVIRAIDLVLSSSPVNSIYNVGTGVPSRFRDLIDVARNELGSNSIIKSIPTPEFHKLVQVRDSCLNVSRIEALGFKPIANLHNEIRLLCH